MNFNKTVKFTSSTPPHTPGAKLLILIRHAESKLNATRKGYIQQPWSILRDGIAHCIDPGLKDAPLTSEGQKQAQSAGEKLARDVLSGNLPRIQLVGVSPLRRTLHTSRIIVQTADQDVARLSKGFNWWVPLSNTANSPSKSIATPPPSRSFVTASTASNSLSPASTTTSSFVISPSISSSFATTDNPTPNLLRKVHIIPYLRERRTTSADQSLVRPAQAVEYWKHSGFDVEVVNKLDLLGSEGINPEFKTRTRARLNQFFTVGLTQRCRKVKIESVKSVNKRIGLLEQWLASRPENVILLVGHSMMFRAWQDYWQSFGNQKLRWGPRQEVLRALGKGKGTDNFEDCSMSCGEITPTDMGDRWVEEGTFDDLNDDNGQEGRFGEAMSRLNVNRNRKVYDCPNAGMLLVYWTPTLKSENKTTATSRESLFSKKKRKKSLKISTSIKHRGKAVTVA